MNASTPLTFRGRLWRWTKRLTFTATLLLVAAVPATYFGLPKLAAHPKARAKVEKALTRTLGTPVRIQDMRFDWKEGLFLRDVSTQENLPGCSFRIDTVTIKPRWSKLLSGKVRLQVELESPEFVVVDSGTEIRTLRLPKFGKKGFGIERMKIVDGTYILKSGADDRTVRVDGINADGSGRLQNRSLRMDLKSLSGSARGVAVTGKGVLRLSQDGFAGELDVNEDAAKEPELRDALHAAGVTLRKAPVLSDPF
jgi:hypothetical protein